MKYPFRAPLTECQTSNLNGRVCPIIGNVPGFSSGAAGLPPFSGKRPGNANVWRAKTARFFNIRILLPTCRK
jgi:hypothetical protein